MRCLSSFLILLAATILFLAITLFFSSDGEVFFIPFPIAVSIFQPIRLHNDAGHPGGYQANGYTFVLLCLLPCVRNPSQYGQQYVWPVQDFLRLSVCVISLLI